MTLVCFGVRLSFRIVAKAGQVVVVHDRGGRAFAGHGGRRGGGTGIDHDARGVQQVHLEHGLGQLGRTRHQLARDVAVELAVGVEVEALLRELGEQAELGDRALALQTGEADAVHAAAVLGQHRHAAGDRADILAGTVEVAVGDGRTRGVDALVVDVAIIQQRHILVDLDLLVEVLRPKDTLRTSDDPKGIEREIQNLNFKFNFTPTGSSGVMAR